MLYPILHRLQADGLIDARWGQSETGRQRKYYHLTSRARPVMDDDRRQWRTVHLILDRLWAVEISRGAASQAPTVMVPAT
jgi:DNA-binding PadR family transcriptional regulator